MAKEIIRISEFRNSDGCSKIKDHEALRPTSLSVEKGLATQITKEINQLYLSGEIDISEIEDIALSGYAGNTGIECEEAEEKQIKKLAAMIRRYCRSEKRHLDPSYKMTLTPHLKVTNQDVPLLAEVLPRFEYEPLVLDSIDVVFEKDNVIEGIIFKSGKPFLSSRGKHKPSDEIPMYLALQCLKKLVPEGEQRTLKLSYYFLMKTTDKKGQPWEYVDFFEGNNVISLTCEFKNTEAAKLLKDEQDEHFFELIEAHEIGHRCSEDDCVGCFMNCHCNFVKTPETMELKEQKLGKKISASTLQQQIIDWDKGILRVIAGAGSGKTETAAEHIKHVIMRDIEAGKSITEICKSFLMITFTNAGVAEMIDRVIGKLANENIFVSKDDLNIMTFNTFAYNIDKIFYKELGFKKEPIVIDDIRNAKIVVQLLNDNHIDGLDYESFNTNVKNFKGAMACVLKAFELIKINEIDFEEHGAALELRDYLQSAGYFQFMTNQSVDEILDLYVKYNQELLDSGLITFADQEPMAIRMLDAHPDYLENLGLQHIVVDEFQDSNEIQMEMVKRLAHTSCFNEMVVVGDDFQAIYAFRNTSPDNMIKFPEKMGLPVSDVYLVENYRSTPEILALADAEIKNNKNQLPKDLVAKKASIGKNPIVKGFYSPDDEVEYTVNLIKQKLSTGNYQPEDFCIITMTNQELVKYQAALAKENIPTVAKNPLKYLENSRVRAALHLAQAFWEPEVTEHYWSYLCARYNGEILNEKSDDEILAEIQDLKNDFLGMENREVSYQRTLFHEYLDALTGNDEIYASFLEMLYACEDLPSELEYAQDFKKYGKDAAKRMEQAYQGVVLTTAHSSKGLEWKVVINSITNYDNSFLHGNGNRKVKELEERRRLLYVSMTRAKDELYVTSQFIAYGSEKEGYTFNQFVEELYAITGEQYIPLDPDADKKKEAAKKAAAARNKAARERKKISEAKKKAYLDAMASAN